MKINKCIDIHTQYFLLQVRLQITPSSHTLTKDITIHACFGLEVHYLQPMT